MCTSVSRAVISCFLLFGYNPCNFLFTFSVERAFPWIQTRRGAITKKEVARLAETAGS